MSPFHTLVFTVWLLVVDPCFISHDDLFQVVTFSTIAIQKPFVDAQKFLFVQFCELLWASSYTDFMESKPVLDNFMGCTMTKLQLMCHFINSHPSVLRYHVTVSFRVVISNGRGCASGSFLMLTLRRSFLNLSINSQTIPCDTTLFPHCTDILLFISAPGTPSVHKKTYHCFLLFFGANEQRSVLVYGTKLRREMDYEGHTCTTMVGEW